MPKKRAAKPKHAVLQTLPGDDGQFYWRCRAVNGRTVSDNEGHPTRSKAKRAALNSARLMAEAARFDVEEL